MHRVHQVHQPRPCKTPAGPACGAKDSFAGPLAWHSDGAARFSIVPGDGHLVLDPMLLPPATNRPVRTAATRCPLPVPLSSHPPTHAPASCLGAVGIAIAVAVITAVELTNVTYPTSLSAANVQDTVNQFFATQSCALGDMEGNSLCTFAYAVSGISLGICLVHMVTKVRTGVGVGVPGRPRATAARSWGRRGGMALVWRCLRRSRVSVMCRAGCWVATGVVGSAACLRCGWWRHLQPTNGKWGVTTVHAERCERGGRRGGGGGHRHWCVPRWHVRGSRAGGRR